MAPVLEQSKVLAGHMPAEKVGGVRQVVRKDRRPSENENNTPPSEGGSDSGKSNDEMKEAHNVLAHTGLAAQTHKDYPEEAVKHAHDKPVPRHQKEVSNNMHNNKANVQIFQPTKK